MPELPRTHGDSSETEHSHGENSRPQVGTQREHDREEKSAHEEGARVPYYQHAFMMNQAAEHCEGTDAAPFERLDIDPDPVHPDLCIVVGHRQGGERSRRLPYLQLSQQARDHLELMHGLPAGVPLDGDAWSHAVTRSAIAFLID